MGIVVGISQLGQHRPRQDVSKRTTRIAPSKRPGEHFILISINALPLAPTRALKIRQ